MEEEKLKYFIDLIWHDDHNRSFRAMAQARFCPSCREKIGTETQERVPTVDQRTGRVVFEVRAVPYGENPLAVIRDCCSKGRGYITPDTPVMEALFRVFLANGNQPIDLDTLREQLEQWVPLYSKPHGYAPDFLQRLIAADDYYGLREFQLTAP